MKKNLRICTLVLAAFMLFSLSACGQSATPAATTPASTAPASAATTSAATTSAASADKIDVDKLGPIMKKAYETGVIEVGYTAQKPPHQFHLMVNGADTIVGFEVAISDFIAEKLSEKFGRKVVMNKQILTVQGGIAALQANKLDCMPTLAATEERKKNLDFSIPYHRSLQTIVVLKSRVNEDKFRIENKMKGVLVAVQKGSSTAITLAEQYPECKLLELEKAADVLISVISGKSDAAILNQKPAILYCKANEEIQIVDELSFDIPKERDPGASYAITKGNEDFVAFVDSILEQIMSDGTFTRFEEEAIKLLDDGDTLEAYKAKNLL